MNLNFAENFKKYRKQMGITQEKIAEELDVSGQSVSRWEIGICYPDLELIPTIANYFGITIDELLSNDVDAREKILEDFYQELNSISDSEKRVKFTMEYCRKYSDDNRYAYQLMNEIQFHAAGNRDEIKKYMPILTKYSERLLQTEYRDSVIMIMSALCDEDDLEKWLDMAPYMGFNRRGCLNNRAWLNNDRKLCYIQNGLEMFEHLAYLLDIRCPDSMGAEVKLAFQRDVMKTIRSLGENDVPDGWKTFYAYKQFVYAACLFGKGVIEEGWANFDNAFELCKQFFALEDEWLDIGGSLFSYLKVDKRWRYAIDKDGNKHQLYTSNFLSICDMFCIYDLLVDPRWAWFDAVRNTEKYKHAVDVIKEMADKNAED